MTRAQKILKFLITEESVQTNAKTADLRKLAGDYEDEYGEKMPKFKGNIAKVSGPEQADKLIKFLKSKDFSGWMID